MVSNIEVLESKINFLTLTLEEVYREMNKSFDFTKFVIDNNLTSTQVVLIIKGLTIMNYRKLNRLNDFENNFKDDSRFDFILRNHKPTFDEFNKFLKSIGVYLDCEKLLKSLEKQKIGEDICKFLLEGKQNN